MLPFSRRQSPSLYFQQQQKELLAHRAPEGYNPSLRKKRGAGFFKRTCSLVFITLTFGFFSPNITRQSLKLVLTHPAEPKSKKSVAREKGETCAPSWPHFQLSGRTWSLGRWKAKEEQLANLPIVQLYIFCSKSKMFLSSRTPICFMLTNVYLSDWDHRVGKSLYWFILFWDGR